MEVIGKEIKKGTVRGAAGRGLQNRSVNSVNLVMRKELTVFWLFCFILIYNSNIIQIFKTNSTIRIFDLILFLNTKYFILNIFQI
jgi:hypothetical protein